MKFINLSPVAWRECDAPANLKLTTVIPVFNGEKYLASALASVAAQERLPDLLIILDNASTDSTRDIVRTFQREQPALHTILRCHDKNIGMIANFNCALFYANNTDCLHILSNDDIIHPRFYSRLLGVLKEHEGVAIAYSKLGFIDADGHGLPPFSIGRDDDKRVSLKKFLSRQSVFKHVYCQSVVLKTDYKSSPVEFRQLEQVADVVFFSEFAAHCQNIISVGETLCSYRIHPEAASLRNVSTATALEEWEAMRIIAGLIKESPLRSWAREQFQRLLFAARTRVKLQQREHADLYELAINKVGKWFWRLGGAAVWLRDYKNDISGVNG